MTAAARSVREGDEARLFVGAGRHLDLRAVLTAGAEHVVERFHAAEHPAYLDGIDDARRYYG